MPCCFCVYFLSLSWGRRLGMGKGGWAGLRSPPSFGMLTSPTADDELSLTGLDHEPVLNCRRLEAAPKPRGESALGFLNETTSTGWEREVGGLLGDRGRQLGRYWRGSQRPGEKEGARAPGTGGLGGGARRGEMGGRAWEPGVRGLSGRAADCGAGRWGAPDLKAV